MCPSNKRRATEHIWKWIKMLIVTTMPLCKMTALSIHSSTRERRWILTEKRARSLLQHTKLQFLVRSKALVGRTISVATAIVVVVIIGSGVTYHRRENCVNNPRLSGVTGKFYEKKIISFLKHWLWRMNWLL